MSHVIRLDSSHNFALIKKHNIMKRTIVLSLQYENAVPTCLTAYGTTKYLYHILGFGGDGNGWYMGQTFQTPADGTFQSACMIYNITPPSN